MFSKHMYWSLFCLLVFESSSQGYSQEVPVIGPTPYLSKADSPFPVNGSNPNFYLEDFEDGELNTLGISQPSVPPGVIDPPWLATIDGPGRNTSSVDADDGIIDGSGRGGHAMHVGWGYTQLSDPPTTVLMATFEFDKQKLGFLPTAFGLVWTDGPADSTLLFRITDELGEVFPTVSVGGLGNGVRDGDSTDDEFVGVVFPAGIASVEIEARYSGALLPDAGYIEIDHVQYGLLPVPEPATWMLLAFGGALLTFFALVRRF